MRRRRPSKTAADAARSALLEGVREVEATNRRATSHQSRPGHPSRGKVRARGDGGEQVDGVNRGARGLPAGPDLGMIDGVQSDQTHNHVTHADGASQGQHGGVLGILAHPTRGDLFGREQETKSESHTAGGENPCGLARLHYPASDLG
jgi:hypothetical protein